MANEPKFIVPNPSGTPMEQPRKPPANVLHRNIPDVQAKFETEVQRAGRGVPILRWDNQDGQFVTANESGGKVRAPDRMVLNHPVLASRVWNMTGVKNMQRIAMKGLADTPEQLRRGARAMGYHVYQMDGFSAVTPARQDQDGKWLQPDLKELYVVDEQNKESGLTTLVKMMESAVRNGGMPISVRPEDAEFARDVTDFTVDAATGALATLGTASYLLGPQAGVPISFAAGAGSEALRQKIAQNTGFREEGDFDAIPIALSGMMTAAEPRVEQFALNLFRGAGRATRGMQGRIMSVKKYPYLSPAEIVAIRADTMPGIIPTPRGISRIYRKVTDIVGMTRMQEQAARRALVKQATDAGDVIDLTDAVMEITDFSLADDIIDPSARAQAQTLMSKVEAMAGRQVDETTILFDSVTPMQVDELRATLGELVRKSGVWEKQGLSGKKFPKKIAEIHGKINKAIIDHFGGPLSEYAQLARMEAHKVGLLVEMRNALGVGEEKLIRDKTGETFVSTAFTNKTDVELIKRFDVAFGTDFEKAFKNSVVGSQFMNEGEKTIPGFLPRFTAGGQLLGMSMFGGGGAGLGMVANPTGNRWEGAALGASLGISFGSPLINIQGTRGVRSLGRSPIGRMLKPQGFPAAQGSAIRFFDPRRTAALSALQDVVRDNTAKRDK